MDSSDPGIFNGPIIAFEFGQPSPNGALQLLNPQGVFGGGFGELTIVFLEFDNPLCGFGGRFGELTIVFFEFDNPLEIKSALCLRPRCNCCCVVLGFFDQHVAALLQQPQDCAFKNDHHFRARLVSSWPSENEYRSETIFQPHRLSFEPASGDRPEPGLSGDLLPAGREGTLIATVRDADLVGVRSGQDAIPGNELLLAEPSLSAVS